MNENEETDHEEINTGVIDTTIDNWDYMFFEPRINMRPLSILIENHAEEKAFPDLFSRYPSTNKMPLI